MSKASWLREFYPISAEAVPKEQAIEHSLQKWKGLRKENLAKHEVSRAPGTAYACLKDLEYKKVITIDGTSCALCNYYYGIHYYNDNPCKACPLEKTAPNTCYNGAYKVWLDSNDPEPMIQDLERTLEAAKKRKGD